MQSIPQNSATLTDAVTLTAFLLTDIFNAHSKVLVTSGEDIPSEHQDVLLK